ncbi:transcriptional regulator [Leptospira langatensis]|uniref:Transcriptional regulator n=1 Tax=Leptospira langatensis TaxID=2484983 RepID=A0A5F1ZYN7_9LEPT|nr:helix-turn-helix domain-containing protein [Leptospira langatensis]TGJ98444.1 transcriptional regulator [Leptospira langatensis]TGL43360.1 transcriptional regulator [Leptospira langatensis]
MKRKSLEDESCPIARSLGEIGEWWSLLIIRDSFLGKKRFGEFEKSLGLAKNILSARLQSLVNHGVLEISPASDGSAYQEYNLSAKGKKLFPILVALRQWGESCLFDESGPEQILVDKKFGKKIKPIEIRSQDGRLLRADDVRIEFLTPKAKKKSSSKK